MSSTIPSRNVSAFVSSALCLAVVIPLISVPATSFAQERATILATLVTSEGEIKLELYPEDAPETVENFIHYAESEFYNGTIFHRVIKGFMIQGGGFTKDGTDMKKKETRDPIRNESSNGLSNKTYTVAMARTPQPNSATSQFFINVADNVALDKENSQDRVGYCVFGKVIEGTEIVDLIAEVKTTRVSIYRDVPAKDIVIESVTIDVASTDDKDTEPVKESEPAKPDEGDPVPSDK